MMEKNKMLLLLVLMIIPYLGINTTSIYAQPSDQISFSQEIACYGSVSPDPVYEDDYVSFSCCVENIGGEVWAFWNLRYEENFSWQNTGMMTLYEDYGFAKYFTANNVAGPFVAGDNISWMMFAQNSIEGDDCEGYFVVLPKIISEFENINTIHLLFGILGCLSYFCWKYGK